MEQVNLEKDLEKLEYYQADSIADQLIVLELHLVHIYEGRMVAFCIECLSKHLRAIKVLSSECIEAYCKPESLWTDCAKWASDFMENKLNTDLLGPKKECTKELASEAREYRKKFGEILQRTYSFLSEKKQEHIT